MMRKVKYTKLFSEVFTEWKWLLRYVKKYLRSIALHIAIGILGIFMGLGTSVASKYLIDAVVSHNQETIVYSAVLAIGLAVSQIIINSVSSRIISKTGTKINTEIRSEFFADMVTSDWESISAYHSGDLINRLEGDISSVSNGIIAFLPNVFTRIAQFVGAFGIVLYYDATMAIIALLGSPVVFFTSRFMMKKIRKYNKRSRETNGKIISYGEETLQNIQMVKAFGLVEQYADNFKKLLLEYRSVKLEHDKFSILMSMCLSLVGLAVSYSCYGWGVWQLWNGVISYGTMTLFISLSSILTSSFSSIVSLAPSAVSIATCAGRIKEISELAKENDADAQKANELLEKAKNGQISVCAENVSFKYKKSPNYVLKNTDFYVRCGETVAITGPSGEGKTTILRLLLGLVAPTDGKIVFLSSDGTSLGASYSTRRLCSYVPQSNDITSGTIAENLRAVRPDAEDSLIIDALKTADAWDFVSNLPDGIYSEVGERGVNFSEGQAQRISIARAVLRSAPVLIMDEATSALDYETEARVLGNIMMSDPNKICIITTHRSSMLKYCNRIYRINEDGSVNIYGTSNETEEI
ncbi:MAG: ABC transporter ATP-binding protein [Ruminococcaceae bacterium]|nr:ABC transporter ATP-binding protein [Oscillospiraceae bacterium]